MEPLIEQILLVSVLRRVPHFLKLGFSEGSEILRFQDLANRVREVEGFGVWDFGCQFASLRTSGFRVVSPFSFGFTALDVQSGMFVIQPHDIWIMSIAPDCREDWVSRPESIGILKWAVL